MPTPFESLDDYLAIPRIEGLALSPDGQRAVLTIATLKKDGTLYLEDQPIEEKALIKQAQQENRTNNHFAIVVRADEDIDYGKVVDLLDHFRSAGISRFGLAADAGGK